MLKGTWNSDTGDFATPDALAAIERANGLVFNRKQSIQDYQALFLYTLAKQYDGHSVIEIGTKYGFSAVVLAQAVPASRLWTVDISEPMCRRAKIALAGFPHVVVLNDSSAHFAQNAGRVHFVFIDGDHETATQDALEWWERLAGGGLMLFHDYTAAKFPNVIEAVALLGEPDLLLTNENGEGMAGVYKE